MVVPPVCAALIMKTRESGMPPEPMWKSFFEPEEVLRHLGLTERVRCAVDLGCGYGTFAIPAARLIRGTVHALDIDPAMIEATTKKAAEAGLNNLTATCCDFAATRTGLADGLADYVMLFNLLHAEEAAFIINESRRVLCNGGVLAVMHWNYDPNTPRGPSMEIRLKPESCLELVRSAGFFPGPLKDLPPYHYGFVAGR